MRKIYKSIGLFLLVLWSFSTNAQTLLSESFEGTGFPPLGWTNTKVTGSGNSWARYTSTTLSNNDLGTAQDGNYAVGCFYSATLDANAWMITPSVTLSAGTTYIISFYYNTGSYDEKLKLTVGSSATIAAQTNILWDNNGGTELNNTDWALAKVNYTAPANGTYYFGFNCYSDKDQYILLLDNVKIALPATTPPACVANIFPENNAVNVAYDPDVTLKWRANKDADTYDLHYKVVGAATDSIITDLTDTTYTLNGYFDDILGNTTYTWFVVPKNSIGENTTCAATNATTFTTAAAKASEPSCVEHISPANNATNVPLSFTLKWHSDPFATQYAVFIGTSSADASFFDTITDTTLTLTAPSSYFGTEFYWFVIPFNAVGEPSADCEASNATTFTFASAPSAIPSACANRTYPVNGATGVPYPGGIVTLTWDAVPDAVGYKIYFANTAVGVTGATSASTTTAFNSIDITGFNSSVTRYWAIVPYNSVGDAVGCLTAYSFTTASVLPVTFGSFTGKRLASNAVQLAWSTLTEINSKGFYVERSIDGINYSSIGFIASIGSSNYSFTDENAVTSTSYYRLKQVDNDGKTAYSSVVTIGGVKITSIEVTSIYPNPASSQISLIIASPESDNINLLITDITGKSIYSKNLQVISGNNKATIDVSDFAKGTYLIKIFCKNGCISNVKKFVKE